MQRGSTLEFSCQNCNNRVPFSLFELEKKQDVECTECNKSYRFEDEQLIIQLQKFEILCKAIRNSEEILSNTSVGIDVEGKQVKIPFKILLTRLSSCLDLKIGGKPFTIFFRFEPLTDRL